MLLELHHCAACAASAFEMIFVSHESASVVAFEEVARAALGILSQRRARRAQELS